MQTKFLQISKFFSKEWSRTTKFVLLPSKIRKRPAAAAFRRSFPIQILPKTALRSSPAADLPGRPRRTKSATHIPPPPQTGCPTKRYVSDEGAAEIHTTAPDRRPADRPWQAALPPPPAASSEQTAQPAPALFRLLVNQRRHRAVHLYLSAIQRERLQL